MTIRIELPKLDTDNRAKVTNGIKVFVSGTDIEIKNVTSIKMNLEADSIISATIDVAISSVENFDNIELLLGEETLHELVKRRGYKLERIKTLNEDLDT